MRRTLLLLAVSLCGVVAPGCDRPAAAPSYAKFDLGGGRYFLDCEDTGAGSSLQMKSTSSGTEVTSELYEFSWNSSHQLRIEDGALTVDGADRGKLQPGDRIVIKPSGEILVNGAKR